MTTRVHSTSSNPAAGGSSKPLPHAASVTGVADLDAQSELAKNVSPRSPYAHAFRNLASAEHARVLFATDEWFATADRLIDPSDPVFDPDAYCEQGKVMDGWETRRRREAGHDWCVIQLNGNNNGAAGSIAALEIDTAHFTGNHVPRISLDICTLDPHQESQMVAAFPRALERLLQGGGVQGTGATPQEVAQAHQACEDIVWQPLLPETHLQPGYEATRMHHFTLPEAIKGTHVRVNYFPDGGVARLRLWGTPAANPLPMLPGPAYSPIVTGRTCTVVAHSDAGRCGGLPSQQQQEQLADDPANAIVELSSQENGGTGFHCTNKHYGDVCNLIQPTLGRDMGDGWETARHPNRPRRLETDPTTGLVKSDLMDYSIIKLGAVALAGIDRVILDTKHFRGNYPESVLVEACCAADDEVLAHARALDAEQINDDTPLIDWFPLVPRGRMAPDSEHVYLRDRGQLEHSDRPVSHVKISIFPDGGLSRVRIYGALDDA